MSLDGAAAADGVADGAVAPVSLEKERQRQESVKNLLQDWTDKAGRERDKALLQAEKARLERDKEKLRFDRAKFWGMLMEACGQKPTAEKPMANGPVVIDARGGVLDPAENMWGNLNGNSSCRN